jgi:hypothetical protein
MPFLQLIESIFLIFLMIAWIWTIIGVISDVFGSDDLSGLAKGMWVLLVIIIPWLGVLAYLIARGEGMRERRAQGILNAEEIQRAYFQKLAGASTADELAKLAELKKKSVITDAEFDAQKAKLLN